MQTITGIVLGISMGGTVLIGYCIGEKKNRGVGKAVGTITILFITIAITLTPIIIFVSNLSVSLMHIPTEAINFARQYIFICACGIPFIVGYNAVSGIFRGIGYSIICGILVCIYCQFSPYTITGVFTKDEEVVAAKAMYLKLYSFDCMLSAFIFCMNSYIICFSSYMFGIFYKVEKAS